MILRIFKSKFEKCKKQHPFYSSIICFNMVLLENKKKIVASEAGRYFPLLVDKDDYEVEDREDLLESFKMILKG